MTTSSRIETSTRDVPPLNGFIVEGVNIVAQSASPFVLHGTESLINIDCKRRNPNVILRLINRLSIFFFFVTVSDFRLVRVLSSRCVHVFCKKREREREVYRQKNIIFFCTSILILKSLGFVGVGKERALRIGWETLSKERRKDDLSISGRERFIDKKISFFFVLLF